MASVAPTITAVPAQSSITNMQVLPVTISVTGTGDTPTGSVALSASGYTSAASTLVNGVAVINVPPGALAVGVSDTLTATYTPDASSSSAYTTATGTATVTVTMVTVSLPTKLQGYKAQLGYSVGNAMTIVAGLKELDGGFKVDELDSTDHGNNGWKSRMAGLNDFEGSAKLDYIAGDASQNYLLQAVLNHTALNLTLFPVDAVGSGVPSFVGPAIITDWKWDGKNTDLEGVQITLMGNGPFSVVNQ